MTGVILAFYLLTSFACARMLWIARVGEARSQSAGITERRAASRDRAYVLRRRFWLILASLLLVLGVAREFAIIAQIADVVRQGAIATGWHEHRFALLSGLVIIILIAALTLLAVLIRHTRGTLPRERAALIGVAALLTILCVRGLSLHHLDAMLRAPFLNVLLWHWLEILSLMPILVAALRNGWWHDGPRLGRASPKSRIGTESGVPDHRRTDQLNS